MNAALWIFSRNLGKYKGILDTLGSNNNSANGLFQSVTTGFEASTFASAAVPPSSSLVLLLDNDCGNALSTVESLFAAQPTLREQVKWIHTLSTGVDVFQFPKYRSMVGSIPVSNARGVFSSILAEHIVFSMLYFNRQPWKLQANRVIKKYERFPMIPLRGQTMGIVGYGNIAEACVAACSGLGINSIGLRRRAPEGWLAGYKDHNGVEIVCGEAGYERILAESDFILNVLPASEENRHKFDSAAFRKMKPTAIYMNIGRGMTQDEQDLADALQQGVIRGAAVDVFEVEPLPEASPLWTILDDKLLLSPHNADITEETFTSTAQYFVELAERFVKGNGVLPQYLVDVHGKGY